MPMNPTDVKRLRDALVALESAMRAGERFAQTHEDACREAHAALERVTAAMIADATPPDAAGAGAEIYHVMDETDPVRLRAIGRAWLDSAAMFHRNERYYHGVCVAIGETYGAEAFTQDDGGVSDGVLVSRLPEIARRHARERANIAGGAPVPHHSGDVK